MQKVYVIGSGPAPGWCAGLLTPYQRPDGQVGYEFHGAVQDFDLQIGDTLIKERKYIKVKRTAVGWERVIDDGI